MRLMTEHRETGSLSSLRGEVYEQTTKVVYLGATVCENADPIAEIDRRVLLAKLRFRRYSIPLNDQPIAPLRLKVGMLKYQAMETMLNECVTWSPTVAHFAILRASHCLLLLRCIGWKRKPRDGYHICFHTQTPWPRLSVRTSKETTVQKRRVPFAGFVARMGK